LPMPLDAPVMTTTLSANLLHMIASFRQAAFLPALHKYE
jgi:hypothetical protein